ncbi:MAG TPA: hypothetical protein VGR63_02485 [Casimicrobiaceae bacterium]|jgi:hypothetical protein|nr:hypothetical protein [Casimicrobiaceae bacterium]
MDPELKELFAVLIGQQTATSKSIGDLAETVTKYVAASDARMARLEENLDGLIRAITSEHSNGKAH